MSSDHFGERRIAGATRPKPAAAGVAEAARHEGAAQHQAPRCARPGGSDMQGPWDRTWCLRDAPVDLRGSGTWGGRCLLWDGDGHGRRLRDHQHFSCPAAGSETRRKTSPVSCPHPAPRARALPVQTHPRCGDTGMWGHGSTSLRGRTGMGPPLSPPRDPPTLPTGTPQLPLPQHVSCHAPNAFIAPSSALYPPFPTVPHPFSPHPT